MTKCKPSPARPRGAQRKISATESDDLNAERTRIILRERATVLASPANKLKLEKPSMSVVPLRIGEVQLAIETLFVLAAVPTPPIINLPRAGAQVEGLSLVRGQLLPIFNLLELMKLGADGAEHHSLLAILGVDSPEVGFSVDEVLPSRTIHLDEVRELDAGDASSPRFVQGITNEGMTVLDGQALLNHPALFL